MRNRFWVKSINTHTHIFMGADPQKYYCEYLVPAEIWNFLCWTIKDKGEKEGNNYNFKVILFFSRDKFSSQTSCKPRIKNFYFNIGKFMIGAHNISTNLQLQCLSFPQLPRWPKEQTSIFQVGACQKSVENDEGFCLIHP